MPKKEKEKSRDRDKDKIRDKEKDKDKGRDPKQVTVPSGRQAAPQPPLKILVPEAGLRRARSVLAPLPAFLPWDVRRPQCLCPRCQEADMGRVWLLPGDQLLSRSPGYVGQGSTFSASHGGLCMSLRQLEGLPPPWPSHWTGPSGDTPPPSCSPAELGRVAGGTSRAQAPSGCGKWCQLSSVAQVSPGSPATPIPRGAACPGRTTSIPTGPPGCLPLDLPPKAEPGFLLCSSRVLLLADALKTCPQA